MNKVIGVLGGMGTFATIHLFQQYADVFQAEKEWDRPRIIIDNRCTMPSRVRAFLYNEKTEQLVEEMSDSMRILDEAGCDRIILACNTSHLFLPQIFDENPRLQNKVVNIISLCVDRIKSDGIKTVYLLASEGTIDSCVYQDALTSKGIKCLSPEKNDYSMLRECIEAVKQNKYSERTKSLFEELVNRCDSCILGCTELPILYEKYRENITCKRVYDPLLIGLNSLKEEFEYE